MGSFLRKGKLEQRQQLASTLCYPSDRMIDLSVRRCCCSEGLKRCWCDGCRMMISFMQGRGETWRGAKRWRSGEIDWCGFTVWGLRDDWLADWLPRSLSRNTSRDTESGWELPMPIFFRHFRAYIPTLNKDLVEVGVLFTWLVLWAYNSERHKTLHISEWENTPYTIIVTSLHHGREYASPKHLRHLSLSFFPHNVIILWCSSTVGFPNPLNQLSAPLASSLTWSAWLPSLSAV